MYEGHFRNNMFNGHGVMTYSDGLVYEGQWQNGKKCGKGRLKKGEQVVVGVFEEDKVVGPNWIEAMKGRDGEGMTMGGKHRVKQE